MSEDTITIKKSELAAAIAEGVKSELDKREEVSGVRTLKRITDRFVNVRMVDGKVVVAFKNRGHENKPSFVYSVTDPQNPREQVQMVDLLLEGMTQKDKGIPVKYTEFIREAKRVRAKVTATVENEWSIQQGITKKREVDGYSMTELDYDVPIEVVGKYRVFTVAVPAEETDTGDSREVKVHENYVNM